MSTEENTIPFPASKLKAETLRTMAKDLGVVSGGKKVELLQRLRELADSGWVTPTKRKPDDGTFESPSTTKKSRTPRVSLRSSSSAALVTPNSTTRRGHRRRGAAAAADEHPPKKQELSSENEDTPNKESHEQSDIHREPKPSVFDDYLILGPTRVFVTGDDLLAMVDDVPAPAALTLWKVSSDLSGSDAAPLARFDHWLIPAHDGYKIQNITAFKEAYKDVLEKQRALSAAKSPRKGAPNGLDNNHGATAQEEPTKWRWYEVSISRSLGMGALAVQLIKGTVEGKGIVPMQDAKEEEGTFWLSEPVAAKQDDLELLGHAVKLLF